MTDNSGVSASFALPRVQAWHGILAAGLAVLTSAGVAVVAHTSDPASADTYLTSVRNAVVRLADGHESTATVGERIPAGAQVRTGQQGGATLSASGRNVYVGALSTVDVIDGVRERLERGQVMVDSRHGARLSLVASTAGTVSAASGSLSRVELATVLRLGVFEGNAGFVATGRQARTAVSALHQVQVPYGFLPGQVTPLALTDDRWETQLASNLVSADQDLSHLAANLGGTDGTALLDAAPASLRSSAATGSGLGEQALSVALAQAAKNGSSVITNLSTVQSSRSAGGSWGVVAALVNARVTSVSALLDQALAPVDVPTTPVVQAAAPPVDVPGLLAPTVTPTLAPTAQPTKTHKPTVKPTKTPVVTPTTPAPGLVQGLVNTVLGLLTPPSPAAPLPGKAVPSPTPAKLLGILPLGK